LALALAPGDDGGSLNLVFTGALELVLPGVLEVVAPAGAAGPEELAAPEELATTWAAAFAAALGMRAVSPDIIPACFATAPGKAVRLDFGVGFALVGGGVPSALDCLFDPGGICAVSPPSTACVIVATLPIALARPCR
jgi:hypothetical protein